MTGSYRRCVQSGIGVEAACVVERGKSVWAEGLGHYVSSLIHILGVELLETRQRQL
jgi:hypothetical protein